MTYFLTSKTCFYLFELSFLTYVKQNEKYKEFHDESCGGGGKFLFYPLRLI